MYCRCSQGHRDAAHRSLIARCKRAPVARGLQLKAYLQEVSGSQRRLSADLSARGSTADGPRQHITLLWRFIRV